MHADAAEHWFAARRPGRPRHGAPRAPGWTCSRRAAPAPTTWPSSTPTRTAYPRVRAHLAGAAAAGRPRDRRQRDSPRAASCRPAWMTDMDGIRALHDLLGGDSNLVSTTVPVGDGLALAVKRRVTAYRPSPRPTFDGPAAIPYASVTRHIWGDAGVRRGRRLDLRLDRARARARLRPGAGCVVPALARVPHDLRRRRAALRSARDDGASRIPRRARSCACRAAAALSSAVTPGTTCTRTETRSCACWSCTRRRRARARRARTRAPGRTSSRPTGATATTPCSAVCRAPSPARRTLHEPGAGLAPLAGRARRPLRQHRASHRRRARAESGRGLARRTAHGGDEVVYALEGVLHVRAFGETGTSVFELNPDDAAYIPQGVAHEYRSYGSARRARALRRRPCVSAMTLAIGIDVGGTKIAAGVVDTGLGRRSRRASSAARGPSAARTRCSPTASPWHSGSQPGGRACRSASASASSIDLDGHVQSAQTLEWRDVDVAGAFGALGPAVVESDVRAAALAEARFGAGRGVRGVAVRDRRHGHLVLPRAGRASLRGRARQCDLLRRSAARGGRERARPGRGRRTRARRGGARRRRARQRGRSGRSRARRRSRLARQRARPRRRS